MTVAGAAVLAAVTAVGYAALGPGFHPPVSAALPDSPLPAVTGPQTSAPAPSAPSRTGVPRQAALPPPGHRSRPSATGTTVATTSARATSRISPTGSAAGPADPTGDGGKVTVGPTRPAGIAPNLDVDRTGTIGGLNDLCLDLNGGVAVDGNQVRVFDCNGTDAQRWTLATDGTLRVAGKCALVVGDGTVHIVTCDGRATARWRVAGRTLVSAADARCLTDPAAGTRSGAGVTVTGCSGAAGQSWSLP